MGSSKTLKNAFKKHPLQNRTNVQIKGGGSKAFWTMFKKTALFWNEGIPYHRGHHSHTMCVQLTGQQWQMWVGLARALSATLLTLSFDTTQFDNSVARIALALQTVFLLHGDLSNELAGRECGEVWPMHLKNRPSGQFQSFKVSNIWTYSLS